MSLYLRLVGASDDSVLGGFAVDARFPVFALFRGVGHR
jgi:hypothetical protein